MKEHAKLATYARAIYRLFFGLLGLSALVTEVVVLVGRGTFDIVNFLSFFTVQTNTLVAGVFLLSAISLLFGKSWRLDAWRSASTALIVAVGIGFALLLAGLEGVELTAVPWDNTVLHYIIPIAALIDYLLDRPQRRLTLEQAMSWLIYPSAYIAYSLVRGVLIGWYPYPFLNPGNEGWASVFMTVILLMILMAALIAGAIAIAKPGITTRSKV